MGSVFGEAKYRAFAEADLFLFPSTLPWESFGLVLVEAAHFGLPCIATQPLVGEGLSTRFHFHIPPGDPAVLTEAILAATRQPGKAEEIRAEALAHFSAARFGSNMRALLTRVILKN
jgi:glycosyltransferase involved in cell wall biosynthesis